MMTLQAAMRLRAALLALILLPIAVSCGKSESFKSLEETKALLTGDETIPILTRPAALNKVLTENSFNLDFNNERSGDDTDMKYSCAYDRAIDGQVNGGSSCDDLPFGPLAKFDAATGKLLWGPLETAGSFELKVEGKNKVGSDSVVFAVDISLNNLPKLDRITDQTIAALKTLTVVPVNKHEGAQLNLSYACRFDKLVDETMTATEECRALPGEPAIKFDSQSGTLNWIPSESATGDYEFEITAKNDYGSDSKIFAVKVGNSESKKVILSYVRDQTLVFGETLSVDVSNTLTNSDDGVNYSCHYDSLADGSVNELLSCDLLPGVPAQKFNPLTGALNWTPSLQQNTDVEVKIKGVKQSDSDNQVFVVSVASQRFGEVGNSALVFNPTSWDFGSVALNSTSTPKTFVITNNASAEVYLGSIASTASDFVVNWNSCPVPPEKLSSLATCQVNVSFTPTTSGQLGSSIVSRFGRSAAAATDYNSVLGLSGRGVGTLTFSGLESITAVTHKSLTLNWATTPAAASFLIFQVTGGSLIYLETLVNTGGTVTSKNISNLTPNTAYTYRVRATDYVGVVESNTVDRTATTAVNRAPNVSDGPAGWQVYSGRTMAALDFNDSYSGNDLDRDGDTISYTCHYDTTIDGNVAATNACSVLTNIDGSNPTFNQFTGIMAGWKPRIVDENISFEFKVTASDFYGLSTSTTFSTTVVNGAPTINAVTNKLFPSDYLTTTDTFSLSFDNIRFSPYTDTDMTYTCTFKSLTTTDSASAACSGLPGTFTLGSGTGELSWLPGTAGTGAYEFTITGTNLVGSHSRTFNVAVLPTFDDSHRLFHIDAQFANAVRGGRNDPNFQSTWRDIADAADAGTLNNFNTAAAWEGAGSGVSPMALLFDGSNDYVGFSTVLNNEASVRFSTWIKTESSTRERVIFSYGDSTNKGLILTNRRLWLGLGNTGASASHYQQVVLADNPDLYWRFTDSTSAADDSSSNNLDGSKVNPVTGGGVAQFNSNIDDAVFDLAGAGVSLTGTAYFQTPNNAGAYYNLNNDWTIEAWFYYPFPTNCSGGCTLSRGNGGDHQIYVSSALLLGSYRNIGGNAFFSSGFDMTSLSQGWHHITAVGSGGSSTTFYIDGAQAGSSIAFQSTSDIRSVGNHFSGNQAFGLIDEFAVYPTILSPAQIQAHYTAGYQGSCNYVMSPGYWYHLAGVVKDSDHSLSLYLNGSPHCTVSKSPSLSLAGSSEALSLGRSAQSAATSWAGRISSLAFHSAGDASEILADYTASKVRYTTQLPLPPSGLRLWLRADQGLYQDVDAADAATLNNDPVALWQDLSGNGGHMQITTGGTDRRPNLKLNVLNGNPVVAFDGVEDVLRNLVDYNIPNTVCVVGRYSDDPANGYRGRIVSGSATNWLLGWYNASHATLGSSGVVDQFHPGAWVHNPNIVADTSWRVYCGDHSTADVQRLFRSNTLLQSSSAGSVGPRGLTLGSYQGTSQWSKSQVAEVIVYNRIISDSERTALFQYLSTRYGL